VIGIHAVASNRNADERMWNIGHWAELIRLLDKDVAFIGTWDDRVYYNRLWYLLDGFGGKLKDFTGRELAEVAIFLRTLDCLVCVNSGIMHIAVMMGVPLVAIVGGTPARIILPDDNPKVKWIEDPELQTWREDGGFVPRVSRLNEIMPEQVLGKINELAH
jgi:ADP-heptose:LPS heptosyltransferase